MTKNRLLRQNSTVPKTCHCEEAQSADVAIRLFVPPLPQNSGDGEGFF